MEVFDLWAGRLSNVEALIGFLGAMLAAFGAIYWRWRARTRRAAIARFQREFAPIRDAINVALGGRAKLWILTDVMPRTEVREPGQGELPWLSKELLAEAAKLQPRENSAHAIALDRAFETGARGAIKYYKTDYKLVSMARSRGIKPATIAGGGLVFFKDSREIILIERDPDVATFPGAIHITGGNYEPAGPKHAKDDRWRHNPIGHAALREIEEEANLERKSAPHEGCLVVVSEEIETEFVSYCYIGLEQPMGLRETVDGSGEGAAILMTFDELAARFESHGHEFVPLGAAVVLAWLGLGAPNQKLQTPLRREALATYKRIIPHFADGLAALKMNPPEFATSRRRSGPSRDIV